MITKPENIKNNPQLSQLWDENVKGHEFGNAQVATLVLLCQWQAIAEQCVEDINVGDHVQVAYENSIGDIKALPQIAMMKQASAEIRALSKQLGIREEQPKKSTTPLELIITKTKSKTQSKPKTTKAVKTTTKKASKTA